jgi:hypothetical protein
MDFLDLTTLCIAAGLGFSTYELIIHRTDKRNLGILVGFIVSMICIAAFYALSMMLLPPTPKAPGTPVAPVPHVREN